jgi:hypothetical protein
MTPLPTVAFLPSKGAVTATEGAFAVGAHATNFGLDSARQTN